MSSLLTMIGLIIGVAAAILLSSFGQGVVTSVNAAVDPFANVITVTPKLAPIQGGPPAKPLTTTDLRTIAGLSLVQEVLPEVTGSTTGAAGQTAKAVTASAPGVGFTSAAVIGTTYNYATFHHKKLLNGTFFTAEQDRVGARVALIGPLLAKALYGPDLNKAIGKTLRINHSLFTVLGVINDFGADANNNIIMPISAARSNVFGRGIGGNQLSSITVKAISLHAIDDAEQQVAQALEHNHHVSNTWYDDFLIDDAGGQLPALVALVSLISACVPIIAAISLLVGGIGVLNIMLMSVTDRTQEIGIRKAIGASDGAILTQFVMEAIALAGIGGLAGVGLGIGGTFAAQLAAPSLQTNRYLSTFEPTIAPTSVIVAFAVTVGIGLISGSYPAWRAAQLEPITALRYE